MGWNFAVASIAKEFGCCGGRRQEGIWDETDGNVKE